jgi:hypothetical protein
LLRQPELMYGRSPARRAAAKARSNARAAAGFMFVVPAIGALSGRDTARASERRLTTGARWPSGPLEIPDPTKTGETGAAAATRLAAVDRVAAVGAAICAPTAWCAVCEPASAGHPASVGPPEQTSTVTTVQAVHRGPRRPATTNVVHPGIDTGAGWPRGGTSSKHHADTGSGALVGGLVDPTAATSIKRCGSLISRVAFAAPTCDLVGAGTLHPSCDLLLILVLHPEDCRGGLLWRDRGVVVAEKPISR